MVDKYSPELNEHTHKTPEGKGVILKTLYTVYYCNKANKISTKDFSNQII